MQNCDLNNML